MDRRSGDYQQMTQTSHSPRDWMKRTIWHMLLCRDAVELSFQHTKAYQYHLLLRCQQHKLHRYALHGMLSSDVTQQSPYHRQYSALQVTFDGACSHPSGVGTTGTAVAVPLHAICTCVLHFSMFATGSCSLCTDMSCCALLQALQDSFRTKFFSSYLNSACDSIRRDGLNVPMVFAWTMWDNFEVSGGCPSLGSWTDHCQPPTLLAWVS